MLGFHLYCCYMNITMFILFIIFLSISVIVFRFEFTEKTGSVRIMPSIDQN